VLVAPSAGPRADGEALEQLDAAKHHLAQLEYVMVASQLDAELLAHGDRADVAAQHDSKPAQPETEAYAPLVFSGMERAKAKPNAPPPPLDDVAALHLEAKPPQPPPATVVLPPVPDPKAVKKGFFGKVRGFFGSIFH